MRSLKLPSSLPGGVAGGEALLWAALFVAPLALGSFFPGAVLALCALSAASLFWLAGRRRGEGEGSVPVPLALVGLGAVALFIGLQLVPLPRLLLRLASPGAAESYGVALHGLPGAPALHPVTLDPPATALELAKALALALAFAAAATIARSHRGRRRAVLALASGGLLLALIGYGHDLVSADRLFGLPVFKEASPPFLTTFGNPNNAAGYLCLTAPLALGLSIGAREPRRRILWGLAFLLEGAAVFLTLSRGGMVAFSAGAVAFALLLWTQRDPGTPQPRRAPARPRAAAAALLALGAVAVAGYLALEPIEGELSTLAPGEVVHEGKLDGFWRALSLVPEFPWTGVGRGAFATAGARVMGLPAGTAQYVENGPIELAVDLGLPMALLLLASLAASFAAGMRRARLSPTDCALAAGLFSLGLQGLADFSLELPGVALPAACALALLAVDPDARPRRRLTARSARALALAALAVSIPAALYGRHDWRAETDEFARKTASLKAADAERAAVPLLARHPASFVVPFALAGRYLAERKPAHALDWLDRALFFDPALPEAHLIAEGALVDLGRREQALLEARLFAEADPGNDRALAALGPLRPTVAELERAVPDSAAGRLLLAHFLLRRGLPGAAAAEAGEAARRAPGDGPTQSDASAVALGAGYLPLAAALARQAIAAAPRSPGPYLALAQALSASGDGPGARGALELGRGRLPAEPGLALALAQFDLGAGRPQAAEADLRRVGPLGSGDSGARAGLLALWGDVYAAEGRDGKAEDSYDGASRIQPRAGYEWRLVALYERESRYADAARLIGRLETVAAPPDRPGLERRRAQDEQRQREFEATELRDRLLAPEPPH